ncbi:Uncharacterised protein [Zhongshania aliphaticivorans]|uniref:Membrane transport protein MMPL domain-containing protein n=1 Tax=Zhongshania aliphaticivorans TaxID=1470434 RepID=A0A5S9NME6_9GAMM|nr:MMPL family transporter [Zhongshania aliphaticivorans]CAA0091613.1 Uncharacterised protein [Zhongshania aliphaticivorans]
MSSATSLMPKQRVFIATWFAILLCAAVFCIQYISKDQVFESNILGLLPSSISADFNQPTIAAIGVERKFIILVASNNTSPTTALNASIELQSKLTKLQSVDIDSHNGNELQRLKDFYRPYVNQLLTADWRHRLTIESPQNIAKKRYTELFSPAQPYHPHNIQIDPFNLAGDWFNKLLPSQEQFRASEIPSLKDGNQLWYIVSGKLNTSPFSPSKQQAITDTLKEFTLQNPDIKILKSGVIFHAAEAASLSKKEISTVGAGSILAIIILVIVVFRSSAALFAIITTLGISVLIGLTSCFLIFEKVHLITIAFGSTLLGLAVDYCFHFLIKYRQLNDAKLTGKRILRGLIFSAATSILAYIFQLISPLSGLQQIAVFMCSGLAAAAINIVVLSFYFHDSRSFSRSLNIFPKYIAPYYLKLAKAKRVTSLVLLIIFIILMTVVINKNGSDDIRNLNSSSQALLKSEVKVQTLLNFPDNQRYLKITAENSQELLNLSATVGHTLNNLGVPTPNANVIGLVLPSISQQQSDFSLIQEKIYGPHGALNELCKLLANDCSAWQLNNITFNPSLLLKNLPQDVKTLAPAFLMSQERETRILLPRNIPITQEFNEFVSSTAKIAYIDNVENLSRSLQLFRHETSLALGVFLITFSLIMLAIYRSNAFAPLITLGISITTSIALGASTGISLFHILALLLVIGLSVDTAVFYLELGLNSETWLAASLSTITSTLAFGLLALSEVPILHQFGSVVFTGLICTWLICPLIFYLFNVNIDHNTKNSPSLCNKEKLS